MGVSSCFCRGGRRELTSQIEERNREWRKVSEGLRASTPDTAVIRAISPQTILCVTALCTLCAVRYIYENLAFTANISHQYYMAHSSGRESTASTKNFTNSLPLHATQSVAPVAASARASSIRLSDGAGEADVRAGPEWTASLIAERTKRNTVRGTFGAR
jgi:hypothetical protein